MRVLITGDREWSDGATMFAALEKYTSPGDTIIEGEARGADRLARLICEGSYFYHAANLPLPGREVEPYPAHWEIYGRGAGPLRNQQMLDSGVDLCLAFHEDLSSSRGTADMVSRCRAAGVRVILFNGETEEEL